MRSQDAVDSFRDTLHLAPGEAAMYVRLCTGGPAKAGDLAIALKLHRNEVYRNAARLLGRGLIEMTMEHPARYAAVSPDRVFENELRSRLAAVEELKDARERIMPLMAQLEAPTHPEKRGVYKVIHGRPEIGAAQNALLDRARESIRWASTFPASARIASVTGGIDALTRRLDAGVRLQAVVRGDERAWAILAPILRHPRAEVRRIEVQSDVRFLIADHAELLMWAVNDASESLRAKEEVAILTTASGLVNAEDVFFDQLWASATKS